MTSIAHKLPRLYAIIDEACFAEERDPIKALVEHARELSAGGATLLQYRNKNGNAREIVGRARELRRVLGNSVKLIMNDRADLCLAAGFDGVHVGQDDITPVAARLVIGPHLTVGFSTHNPVQVRDADAMPLDYIAVGPVFVTGSKANPDPVIGLDGVRAARALTDKRLVAIGGITRANCRSVIDAGADSVAVIGDLLSKPSRAAAEFLSILS
jgi:thiamine-phosphate pyrophosphorylase